MLYDVLQESRAYQKIKQEGRKEGELHALRQITLTIIQARFPKIMNLAKKHTDAVDDPVVLQALITNIITAQTIEEAKQHLLSVDEEEEGS